MREIKFRAWDNGRLVYDPETFVSDTSSINDAIANWTNSNAILMQYTGLKDKNDKEIYEGDILEVKFAPFARYTVVFREGAFWTRDSIGTYIDEQNRYGLLMGKHGASEVIGNIYDNPELLENK